MAMSFDSYMKDMVKPMREDLTRLGITELLTPEQVEEAIEKSKDGTMLLSRQFRLWLRSWPMSSRCSQSTSKRYTSNVHIHCVRWTREGCNSESA